MHRVRTWAVTLSACTLAASALAGGGPAYAIALCADDGTGRTIVGTSGDDVLVGTSGPDTIRGLGGADEIHGLGGNDVLIGGPGPDRIYGDECADQLSGDKGDDTLIGGPDVDRLFGGDGYDIGIPGGGTDLCDTEEVDSRVFGVFEYFTVAGEWTYGPYCGDEPAA
jgi:Ca2+-binding RTX toxin-like protein